MSAINDATLEIPNVLVPIDFSATSEKTLIYAVALARRFLSRITLLHIILPLPYPVDMVPVATEQSMAMGPARRELDALAEKFVPAALRGESVVHMGVPYEMIVDYARREKIDLIIIGTHGRSDFAHIFLGSVAERVVRHADGPVLVVRPK